jgi:phage anti-repressor protein
MQEIIAVEKKIINGAEVNSVNSRDIYEYLEVDTHYSTWIKRAIDKYDFVEGEDFQVFKNEKSNSNNPMMDFIVTLDMAKELCMVSNTPKGKETRKYFIAVEKEANKPMSTLDMVIASAQEQKKLQAKMQQLEEKVNRVQDKISEDVAEVIRGVVDHQRIPDGFIPLGTIEQHWNTGMPKHVLKQIATIYNVGTSYYKYQNEEMYLPQQHTAYRITDMRWAIGQFLRTVSRETKTLCSSTQHTKRFKMNLDVFEDYGLNKPRFKK